MTPDRGQRDFTETELARLLALMDDLHCWRPERSPDFQIWLPFVRDLAVNGELDLAMKDLADWIGDAKPPTIAEHDRDFLVGLAAKFSWEGAEESLRSWFTMEAEAD